LPDYTTVHNKISTISCCADCKNECPKKKILRFS